MNRYFVGGLLSLLALVAASGSGLSETLTNWTTGQLPQPTASPTANNVPPLEQAGQFIQRQAPVAVDQTLGRTAQQSNNVPSTGDSFTDSTLPSQPMTVGQTGGVGTDPMNPAPGSAPTNAVVNQTPASAAGAATNPSLDAIPALW